MSQRPWEINEACVCSQHTYVALFFKKDKFVVLDSLGVSVDILGEVKCLNWMSISCHGWIPRLALSPAYFQDEVPEDAQIPGGAGVSIILLFSRRDIHRYKSS